MNEDDLEFIPYDVDEFPDNQEELDEEIVIPIDYSKEDDVIVSIYTLMKDYCYQHSLPLCETMTEQALNKFVDQILDS